MRDFPFVNCPFSQALTSWAAAARFDLPTNAGEIRQVYLIGATDGTYRLGWRPEPRHSFAFARESHLDEDSADGAACRRNVMSSERVEDDR